MAMTDLSNRLEICPVCSTKGRSISGCQHSELEMGMSQSTSKYFVSFSTSFEASLLLFEGLVFHRPRLTSLGLEVALTPYLID